MEEDLYSTNGSYGVETLVEPPDATVDIVFVHGLTGNRRNTWTKKLKQGDVFWPQDLLPKDLPSARIITYGYDADIVRALDISSANTIRDHGKSLATDLARRRRRTNSVKRPLIFVAHSLGGLVCEQALLISRGAAEDYTNALLDFTAAIAFIGTPHAGSDLARWASILTGLSAVLKKTNKEIVRVLQPGSEMLSNLQQEFHGLLEQRQVQEKPRIAIFCYFEEVGVTGLGKIVPDHSAVLPRYPNQSIHANHMDMTKFHGANDAGYMAVSEQLWIWADDLERSGSSSQSTTRELTSQSRQRQLVGNSFHAYQVNSGGGTVIFGNQNASGDINNTF